MSFYLAAIGDSTDLSTWSNTPYYLLQAGLNRNLISEGLPLKPEHLRFSRLLWNLSRPLLGSKPGGYQYTERFSRHLLSEYCFSCDDQISIISLHPMLPAWPWPEGWQVSYYIDMTTLQTFEVYGVSAHISRVVRQRALQQEREAFTHSSAIVCMCQWAADSVIDDYGINSAKVHVVPGGANLDEAHLAQLPAASPPPLPSVEQPLRLGFLGKEWQRKGGPFLLQLADALQQRGIPAVIRAIGPDPPKLPAHPALQPLGFINKQTDTARFVAELRSWHFGTLFSEAEASPRSNLECLRLGVPVLAHAVGGIPSTLPDGGCGQLFAAHPSAAAVADWIAARLTQYEGYLAWRAALGPRWREFTWEAAVEQLAAILQPS
jgi:glycosyltransferase involved in cell wall biosynthesis